VNRREFVAGATVLSGAFRFAPGALARLEGGGPLALVTADTESRVVAVDPRTGRIVERLATLPGPRSIESVGRRFAVVAHTRHGAVSIVETAPLRVRHVLRGFVEPRYTAAHPDGRHAFVTDSKRGDVSTVDVLRGVVLGRAALGGPARHISRDPAGRLLWVSLGSKAEHLAIVDVSRPARPRFVRRVTPPFLAHDVGFTPDGSRVWVTSGNREALAVYAARSGDVLHRLAADAPPQHVTFMRTTAYVTSGDDGTLRVHRLDGGRVLHRTSVPVGSYNVQEGWGLVLTPSLDRGTLCVVGPRGQLRHRVQVAASSHDACFVTAA
jgi:DNA-binding beta-propeller fold protein YncE